MGQIQQLGGMLNFTIQLAPVTKKNSQRMIGVRGRTIPIPSKAYAQYEKESRRDMPRMDKPIDYPVNVKALYYMKTKRRVDITNLHSALHDVLVKHGVLKDDNSQIVVSTDGSRVLHDPKNPRTEVFIERAE